MPKDNKPTWAKELSEINHIADRFLIARLYNDVGVPLELPLPTLPTERKTITKVRKLIALLESET